MSALCLWKEHLSVWPPFTNIPMGAIYDPIVSEPKQELLWWVSAWQSSYFPTLIASAWDRSSQPGQANRLQNPRQEDKARLLTGLQNSEFPRIWPVSLIYRLHPNSRQERKNRSCPQPPSTKAASPPALTPWHLLSPGTCEWEFGNAGARLPAGSPVGSVPHGEALRCLQSQWQAIQLAEGAHQTPQYPLEIKSLNRGENN